ncbi:hypothetical protein W04_1013 [Pseudoalteromonas sp. SW0106-04]|nr:hypothetical protein W04_1013 [Pseudoalteromonas sp. SW0106-04]
MKSADKDKFIRVILTIISTIVVNFTVNLSALDEITPVLG